MWAGLYLIVAVVFAIGRAIVRVIAGSPALEGLLIVTTALTLAATAAHLFVMALARRWNVPDARRAHWREENGWRLVALSGLSTGITSVFLWRGGAMSLALTRGQGTARALVLGVILAPWILTAIVVLTRIGLCHLEQFVIRYDTATQARRARRRAQSTARAQTRREQEAKEAAVTAARQAQIAQAQQLAAERHAEREALRRQEQLVRWQREQERKQTASFIRAELKANGQLRWRVFARDRYTCRGCGATGERVELTIDHIHPVSLGGTNDESNLQTLCRSCNSRKGAR